MADGWEEAARRLTEHVNSVLREVRRSNEFWTGATADEARDNATSIATACDDTARRLVVASVAARDGADQIAAALASVRTRLAEARDGGFDVSDDAMVSILAGPPALLVALSGGDPVVARDMLTMRADELSKR
ncbi:MAG TPA: alpha/beta hydrolase, partial [Mycobacterium sp.]|nr:alpha/beta hydrolase [Mycobacterium sp.]